MDTSSRRDSVVVGTAAQWTGVVHNSKWLVVSQKPGGLRVWRLNQSRFPEGEALNLDVSDLEAQTLFGIVKLFMTHSQPIECIGDGDELCLVTDKNSHCCLWIVDIQKTFESRALVVMRQLHVSREIKWKLCPVWHIFSDRKGMLLVIFVKLFTGNGKETVIQDVFTGDCTVLQTNGRCAVFEAGTNKMVREWISSDKCCHWENALFIAKGYDGIVSCWDALCGIHLMSFTVIGVKDFTLSRCLSIL
ncbi:hypothetical protein Pelo_19425 [Pelomyxa schiedti]|nr:hypothetical protein Pelo_19425 [Pelomyxa schiedti]